MAKADVIKLEQEAMEGARASKSALPNFQPLPKENLKVVWLPLKNIQFNVDNANEMNQQEFEELVESIRTKGFTNPIQVRPLREDEEGYTEIGPPISDDIPWGRTQSFEVVAGQHRYQAIEVALPHWTEAPCIVNDTFVDKDTIDMTMVSDNAIHGKINKTKFTKLVDRLAQKYGKEVLIHSMGFVNDEMMDKYIMEVGAQALPNDEARAELRDKVKKKQIKTMEDLSRIVNQLIAKYGHTLEYDFMYFDYGGHTHVQIQMRKATRAIVDEVASYCVEHKRNINDIIAKALTLGWDKMVTSGEISKTAEVEEDDNPFEDVAEHDDARDDDDE